MKRQIKLKLRIKITQQFFVEILKERVVSFLGL